MVTESQIQDQETCQHEIWVVPPHINMEQWEETCKACGKTRTVPDDGPQDPAPSNAKAYDGWRRWNKQPDEDAPPDEDVELDESKMDHPAHLIQVLQSRGWSRGLIAQHCDVHRTAVGLWVGHKGRPRKESMEILQQLVRENVPPAPPDKGEPETRPDAPMVTMRDPREPLSESQKALEEFRRTSPNALEERRSDKEHVRQVLQTLKMHRWTYRNISDHPSISATTGTVGNWVSGTTRPSAENMAALEALLNDVVGPVLPEARPTFAQLLEKARTETPITPKPDPEPPITPEKPETPENSDQVTTEGVSEDDPNRCDPVLEQMLEERAEVCERVKALDQIIDLWVKYLEKWG